MGVRFAETMIHTLRGHPEKTVSTLAWLEGTSRDSSHPDAISTNLATVAFAKTALGNPGHALALLSEIDTTPDIRENISFAARLPLMVRIALTLGDLELAQQLIGGVEDRTPFHEHALIAANAALNEASGEHGAAADGYADASRRWQTFGVVPEQAFALLGQGRCLVALGHPTDAAHPLRLARDIFQELQAAPALAETDALLRQATALSS
jgi:hypothetical protein